MGSKTAVLAPIISALIKTEEKLGADRIWRAVNAIQEKFLQDHFSKKNELNKFKPEELRSWISDNADELNAILKKEGFDIQLDEFDPKNNEFGVVSILDVLVEWVKEAKEIKIEHKGKIYPAVSMKAEAETENGLLTIFEAYETSENSNPIACIHTKSGDKVFMTISSDEITDKNMVEKIEQIRNSDLHYARYNFLEFPMIDYDEKVDISWLIGMLTTDDKGYDWFISQAKQQTKFKMNHKGAHVKSAVAIAIMKCMSANPRLLKTLRIDKPFLLWIERDGLSIPIKYAYYDIENWKDPKSLDM